jgi:hypothetical protein
MGDCILNSIILNAKQFLSDPYWSEFHAELEYQYKESHTITFLKNLLPQHVGVVLNVRRW